jgi:hypothetical protein
VEAKDPDRAERVLQAASDQIRAATTIQAAGDFITALEVAAARGDETAATLLEGGRGLGVTSVSHFSDLARLPQLPSAHFEFLMRLAAWFQARAGIDQADPEKPQRYSTQARTYTTKEAAELSSVKLWTLYSWVERGILSPRPIVEHGEKQQVGKPSYSWTARDIAEARVLAYLRGRGHSLETLPATRRRWRELWPGDAFLDLCLAIDDRQDPPKLSFCPAEEARRRQREGWAVPLKTFSEEAPTEPLMELGRADARQLQGRRRDSGKEQARAAVVSRRQREARLRDAAEDLAQALLQARAQGWAPAEQLWTGDDAEALRRLAAWLRTQGQGN